MSSRGHSASTEIGGRGLYPSRSFIKGGYTMFRTTLLTTSALIAATSLAIATGQFEKMSHATRMEIVKEAVRRAFERKMPGVIFDRKSGTPMAIQLPLDPGKQGKGGDARVVPRRKVDNFSKSKKSLYIPWFGWFAGNADMQYGPSTYSYCYSYSAGGKCVSGYYEKFSEKVNIAQSAAEPFTGLDRARSVTIAAAAYSGAGDGRIAIYESAQCAASAASCPGTAIPGASGTFSSAPAYTGLCCSAVEAVNFPSARLDKKKTYWVVVNGKGETGPDHLIWFGQSSNWTEIPNSNIMAYNESGTTVVNLTYKTFRSSYHETIHTTYHSSTGGWIHTTSYTYEEEPGAFSVN